MASQIKVSVGPILSGSFSQNVAHSPVPINVKGDMILSSLAGPGVGEEYVTQWVSLQMDPPSTGEKVGLTAGVWGRKWRWTGLHAQ